MSYNPALQGFGASLANAYQRKMDVINRGFSGYNTDWAIPVFRQLLPTKEDQAREAASIRLITIFFGANDAALPISFQHVPLDRFEENLNTLVSMVRSEDSRFYNPKARLILITQPPLNEPQWQKRCEESGDPLNRTWESARAYAEKVRDVGRERDVVVADLWTAITNRCEQENRDLSDFLFDGLHLNGNGYQVLYDLLMETIGQHFREIHPDALEMELPYWRQLTTSNDLNKDLIFPKLADLKKIQRNHKEQIRHQTWIKPLTPTPPNTRIPLSDWDVVMFKSYTPLLLFYNGNDSPDFMKTELLTDALSRALDDFYPMAGRLVDIGQGRDEINCCDAGVLFQARLQRTTEKEAEYDEALSKFREDGYLPNRMDYHHMFAIHFYRSADDPLVAIQLTRFKDGGVALGVMILHKVADTYSICMFLDAWAKRARQVKHVKPVFDRNLVAYPANTVITDEAIQHYREEHRINRHPHVVRMDPNQPKFARTAPNGPKPLKTVILEFHSDGLHHCKKDAHTPQMLEQKNWLGTKDALFAMLLRAIVRCRNLEPHEECKMVLAVNGRSKMKNTKEMDYYFGNWMISRWVSVSKAKAENTALVDTAMAFRQQFATLKASLFHGVSKLYTMHEDMTVHYLSYAPNSDTYLTASDVSNLPFWRLDFGSGKPDRTRGYITSGGNGCLVIFGRSDSTKGPIYDVQLQMDSESISRFIEDPDVKKYTKRVLY
ncbi:hypothetical protein EC973_009559 [Apophysomyces ossiformis]|uniref:SGNH hydrolase-type esterase domain-containing protein n=1 Tax=Apophysomyces ossiformis TaxID=679940 RepID=A0A8H7BM40_9FUNG|nr:hypothetical protein EC973_009559 [Apophysomyces ossiformis]